MFEERRRLKYPGIINENIYASKMLQSRFNHPLSGYWIRNVTRDRGDFFARRVNLRLRLGQNTFTSSIDDNLSAESNKSFGGGSADPRPTTSNQSHFILKSHYSLSFDL